MEPSDIEVGKMYWIAGQGPMTVTKLARIPAETSYTLQPWPKGMTFWAGIEQFTGAVTATDLEKYRHELARVMRIPLDEVPAVPGDKVAEATKAMRLEDPPERVEPEPVDTSMYDTIAEVIRRRQFPRSSEVGHGLFGDLPDGAYFTILAEPPVAILQKIPNGPRRNMRTANVLNTEHGTFIAFGDQVPVLPVARPKADHIHWTPDGHIRWPGWKVTRAEPEDADDTSVPAGSGYTPH